MSDQSLLNKLEQISYKYDEIAKQIVDPDIISDMKRYVSLNREYKELSEIVIGQEKGDDLNSRIERNFGMMRPAGYRKCIRLMKLAD